MKLAAIEVGDGQEAAILRRDDGTVDWTPGRPGWRIEISPPALSLTPVPAGTLVAGELPAGATSVEVRGDVDAAETVVAGGLFLALVPYEPGPDEVFVLFRDQGGSIVQPWRGEELKRTPMATADALCPACGGKSWDRVEWRAEPEAPTARTRAVVCRTCAHLEGGVELVGRRRGGPEPARAEPEASPLPNEPTPADVVRVAPFPVYRVRAPQLRSRGLGRYGYHSGLLDHVELRFERKRGERRMSVLVSSGRDPGSDAERARHSLISHLRGELWSTVVDELRDSGHDALRLKHRELERPVAAAVRAAHVRQVALLVDERPTDFAVVAHGEWWAAAAGQIALVCRDVTPQEVQLATLEPATTWATAGAP